MHDVLVFPVDMYIRVRDMDTVESNEKQDLGFEMWCW